VTDEAFRTDAASPAHEAVGIFVLPAAGVLTLSLLSYNPFDPSFNTATGQWNQATDRLPGAVIADLCWQGFGLAALLFCCSLSC
jgi:S-DNA-T family DNA segregation ATPase FtsK/SpoIIIE